MAEEQSETCVREDEDALPKEPSQCPEGSMGDPESAVIELRRPSQMDASQNEGEDAEASWGGGPQGLTLKVGLLAVDLENMNEGIHRLACESEEIVQAIFERIGILHCRTSRIETVLGLPPWEPPGSPAGECAQSPRSPNAAREEGEEGYPDRQDARQCCLRGHALEPSEETDGPPKMCGFCKCSKLTHFQCSEGCYFHACGSCVLGLGLSCGQGLGEEHEREEDEKSDAPTKVPGCEMPRSRSPSTMSDEEPSTCAAPMGLHASGCPEPERSSGSRPGSGARSGCGRSRPMTPSTMMPEEDCSALDGQQPSREDMGSAFDLTWGPDAEMLEEKAGSDSEAPGPLRRPRSAGGASSGGSNGMKARLCSLEAEVRDLASALASGGAVSADALKSTASSQEALAAAAAAAEKACAVLRQELAASATALRTEFAAAVATLTEEQVRESSKRWDSFKEELGHCTDALEQKLALRAETWQKELGAGRGQDSVRQELVDLVARCKGDLRRELADGTESIRNELTETAASLREEISERPEASTAAQAEGELRGRARASRGVALAKQLSAASGLPSPTSVGHVDGDGTAGPAILGLARGLTAVAKSLGLARGGEEVGSSEWSYDEVGFRIEEAWAARAKEAWHMGLPPRPDLFDFLQDLQSTGGARPQASVTALPSNGCPRLPDRREAARLANRLASTSPSPVAVAGLRSDSSNSFFQAQEDELSVGSAGMSPSS
ncbi:unnamed protein product, partial [Polarella glacialis]